MNLVSLENFKFDLLILVELYFFFIKSVNEIAHAGKLINLYLIKNIILLINSNTFLSLVLPFSTESFIRYSDAQTTNLIWKKVIFARDFPRKLSKKRKYCLFFFPDISWMDQIKFPWRLFDSLARAHLSKYIKRRKWRK